MGDLIGRGGLHDLHDLGYLDDHDGFGGLGSLDDLGDLGGLGGLVGQRGPGSTDYFCSNVRLNSCFHSHRNKWLKMTF